MNGFKKQRGKKRYYKNLAIKNDFDNITWLNLEDSKTWFDNWHLHFDWNCLGNKSFKKRKPHLDKLFRHFDILVEKMQVLQGEFQLYSIILDYDSGNDALFLHTPNPNNSQFPFEISNLQSSSTLKNKEFNQYLYELSGYIKLFGNADEAFCILFKKNIGNPFTKTANNN